jgi:hypothetical protein
MPGLARRKPLYPTPREYLDAVTARKLNHPVIGFHIRSGFEPIGVLENYLSGDAASMGHATHMVWRNPYFAETHGRGAAFAVKETVRVATVQLQARKVASFEEFISNLEYFVDVTSDYRSDFVVFPELFTLQLLSLEEKKLSPVESIEALTRYTPRFVEALRKMAVEYNINILGGYHPTRTITARSRTSPMSSCATARCTHRRRFIRRRTSGIGGTSRAATGCTPSRPTADRSAS